MRCVHFTHLQLASEQLASALLAAEIGFPMFKSIGAVLLALLIAPLASAAIGCADRTIAVIDIDHVAEEKIVFDVSENRDVDILFVVDNSRSMLREQELLADKFSNVIDALGDHPDGVPSIHIAVATTDLGGGGEENACGISGDGGLFQGGDCSTLDGAFLKSIVDEDGTRTENFTGPASDTLSCMAKVGIDGCGFEQPLEAMRRALSAPQADSFLREHAYLVVVIVTDEDDCSAKNTDVFNAQRQLLNSELGPAKSFRCFEFGVECEQVGDVRAPGGRSGCVPRDDSPYLYDVNEYVDFLYGLKNSPRQVLVATIAGLLDPVFVELDNDGTQNFVALGFSCNEVGAEAVPPIRLSAFVQGFAADSGQETSICDPSLGDALDDIANRINERVASCLQGELEDLDPTEPGLQVECIVSVTEPGTDERRLVECDNQASPETSSVLPCFTLNENPSCEDTPTGLAPKVHYPDGFTVPFGTSAKLSCLAP